MPYLKELGRQNMADLKKLIEWNVEHHIYFMRSASFSLLFTPPH
jgi:UV DNA damage endonuclease